MGQGILHYYPLSTEGRKDMERLVSSGGKYGGECTGFVKKIANLLFVR